MDNLLNVKDVKPGYVRRIHFKLDYVLYILVS